MIDSAPTTNMCTGISVGLTTDGNGLLSHKTVMDMLLPVAVTPAQRQLICDPHHNDLSSLWKCRPWGNSISSLQTCICSSSDLLESLDRMSGGRSWDSKSLQITHSHLTRGKIKNQHGCAYCCECVVCHGWPTPYVTNITISSFTIPSLLLRADLWEVACIQNNIVWKAKQRLLVEGEIIAFSLASM